jgi:hypothetical protein
MSAARSGRDLESTEQVVDTAEILETHHIDELQSGQAFEHRFDYAL